jgi:hypothetical protein
MSRGILAVFGQVNKETFHTIKLFTNSYNLPLITWSEPVESDDDSSALNSKESTNVEQNQETEKNSNNHDFKENFQLFLQPDLGDTLIFLIKQNNWKKIYYIYNYKDALYRINKILTFQTDELNYVTDILIHKLEDISECQNLLRLFKLFKLNDDF